MERRSQATGIAGSTFVRLLARMADDAPAPAPQGFAQRLGQWVTWKDAISLSAALNAGVTPATAGRARARPPAFEREVQGLRETLAKTVADDAALNGDDGTDFLPFRRHYLGKQQAMDVALGPQRERLRAAVAATGAHVAPLAALDAAMADVLAGQERALFATVPVLLEKHFERLRSAPAGGAAPSACPAAWLDAFRRDLRQLLLAELDLRLQPVEGLLEAWRAAANAPAASPVTTS